MIQSICMTHALVTNVAIHDILKQMSQSLQSMSHADQPPYCLHTGQLASYRVTESK